MIWEEDNTPPEEGEGADTSPSGASDQEQMSAAEELALKEFEEEIAKQKAEEILGTEKGKASLSNVKELEAVYDVPVQISAVLGRAIMPVNQLLKLGRGAVVQLDRRVGESIDIYVNNRLVARGEVVMMEDRLGVTMTEIIKTDH